MPTVDIYKITVRCKYKAPFVKEPVCVILSNQQTMTYTIQLNNDGEVQEDELPKFVMTGVMAGPGTRQSVTPNMKVTEIGIIERLRPTADKALYVDLVFADFKTVQDFFTHVQLNGTKVNNVFIFKGHQYTAKQCFNSSLTLLEEEHQKKIVELREQQSKQTAFSGIRDAVKRVATGFLK